MYVREAALPVAAGQGRVPLPADVVDVAEAALSGRVPPLVRVSAREAAEPRAGMAWYRDQGRTLGLAPAPAAAGTLTLRAWILPWAPGETIDTVERADDLVTVTTTAAHGLHAGERVTLHGVSDAAFHGDFTVTAAPTDTQFCVVHTDGASAGGGVVGFAGGVLPLRDEGDVPAFAPDCHDVLARLAVLRLAGGVLADDPRALAACPAAAARVKEALAELRARAIG